MSIVFNGEFPEPSNSVGFAKNTLVRDAENRAEECLPNALKNQNTQVYIIVNSTAVVIRADKTSVLITQADIIKFDVNLEHSVVLGDTTEGSRLAVSASIDEDNMPAGYEIIEIRSLLYQSKISEADIGAVAQGASLLAWHNTSKFCGTCGAATVSKIGGYRRDCNNCGNNAFPRTDPAVIMLAIKDDKCLLGRSPHFPEFWYSTLAGFVEPGETIEDAVRREVLEESGIIIKRVKYFASQPWPFPHSLMIGVHCEAVSDQITINESELEDCRWFGRDEIRNMINNEHPKGFKCPPTKAIAHAIIKAWVD